MNTTTRRVAPLLAATALLGAAVPGTAQAADGRYQVNVHVEYESGRTTDFKVGEIVMVSVKDSQGTASPSKICWSPAPIDRPACSPSAQGAPATVGTQKLSITMSDGSTVTHEFPVGQAATQVQKNTAAATAPVPLRVTCASQLYGQRLEDGTYAMPLGVVAAGQQVAAYYDAGGGYYQVAPYGTFTPGFMAKACLQGVSVGSTQTKSTYTLKSNTEKTYRLKIPKTFKVQGFSGDATGVSYAIDIKGGGFGDGVANPISKQGGGVHLPFLGATVVKDGYDAKSKAWFVRVKTGKLKKPLTLEILAYGTRTG